MKSARLNQIGRSGPGFRGDSQLWDSLVQLPSFSLLRSWISGRARSAIRPFQGVHQLDWFDWLLLVPYFLLLAILAIYGAHRYVIVRRYLKYKSRIPLAPARRFEQLPKVTIQLPLFNERNVVDQLLEAVLKVRYPRELLDIQVLDDSTDDTHPYTEALVARLKAQGHPIEYIHRTNRVGFKAGALQNGIACTEGEFMAVFDADFVPPEDFLEKTIHFFADPSVGVVQTRWDLRQPRPQPAHRGAGAHARRPLRPRARGPLRPGPVLQLQRHRRHPAPQHDRRRRRLAARHASPKTPTSAIGPS